MILILSAMPASPGALPSISSLFNHPSRRKHHLGAARYEVVEQVLNMVRALCDGPVRLIAAPQVLAAAEKAKDTGSDTLEVAARVSHSQEPSLSADQSGSPHGF